MEVQEKALAEAGIGCCEGSLQEIYSIMGDAQTDD